MRARSTLLIASLVAVGLTASSVPVSAAQHLMKVREVYAGSALDANADFVELQMYMAGQTVVGNHKLFFYDANGNGTECTIPSNVTNGGNQATILFATSQAQTAFGTADFTIPSALIPGQGGAICFDDIDCVSWGSFSGAPAAKDRNNGPGTPEPGGIPLGESLDRRTDISGGPTTLEDADDTNQSANDLEAENESATSNGPVNLGSLTCKPGGGGGTDTDEPSSKITAPKHRTAIDVNESNNFQGTAKDQAGSVAKVEIALRQKRKGGCKWWSGSAFVSGPCAQKVFAQASGDKKWSYDLPKPLKPTGKTIRNYILYSRATDAAGNVESEFLPKANKVKFEVFKAPIVCGNPPC